MSDMLSSLVDMGFPSNRAEKALAKTNHQSVQQAMDWLLAHQDDPDIDEPYVAPQGHVLSESSTESPSQGDNGTGASGSDTPLQAKSLKCDDCGKILKDELAAQAHAARTKHQNFSESADEVKPLTEEEKKAQLAKLEEKMKAKRAEKEEQEKKEQIDREKLRRKQGQELTQIKQDMAMREAKKLAEERKRERIEEKRARERVKEQIAKDKADREAALKKEKASTTAPTAAATQPATAQPTVKKEYDTCRLQIRLFGGSAITHTFKATDTLVDVNRHILMNRTDDGSPYSLVMNFPKKIFQPSEMDKTLKELGLVPSAVLILGKPQ
ncbi:UBX domain-containing protein 1-A-like [Dysidea avara]|uniref:UBX domain-containing protein 1-A-like n=1 Tax=Dysidea avara TaxID=196820 RepID=UPI00331E3E43